MLFKETVYITPDDFKNRYGIDLRNALRSNDNESNQAEIFIELVTDSVKSWIDANTFRRIDYFNLTPFQLNQFKKALLAQTYYTFKEGVKALGLSSGTDDERGQIIDRNALVDLQICSAAINYLSNAGLFNLAMQNRPRVLHGYPEVDMAGEWYSINAPIQEISYDESCDFTAEDFEIK